MYDYDKLIRILDERNILLSVMGKDIGISSRTIAKIRKGEKLSLKTLDKIGAYLGVDSDKLFRVISPNPLLQSLRDEKNNKISGGIYNELQIRMTYNSNHIEGSKLSEDQTRLIYETKTIFTGEALQIDDIIETVHHFRAIDYCIDKAEEPLTQDIIKELHFILKHDTNDSSLPRFAVGDYKKRANMVGGKKTSSPQNVERDIGKLLDFYNNKTEITIEDIIEFHAEFEIIHPFQDGNGRVGRLIVFKECLKNNIVPFIIEDDKKSFYYRGLSNWKTERGYLIDTCLDGQDTIVKLMHTLGYAY